MDEYELSQIEYQLGTLLQIQQVEEDSYVRPFRDRGYWEAILNDPGQMYYMVTRHGVTVNQILENYYVEQLEKSRRLPYRIIEEELIFRLYDNQWFRGQLVWDELSDHLRMYDCIATLFGPNPFETNEFHQPGGLW